MRSAPARHLSHVFGEVFLTRPGSSGRLVLSWTMAGGIGGGGVLIGGLALAGVVQPGVHVFAAEALFLVGFLLGFAHAVLLGLVGRPASIGLGGAAWRMALATLVCAPALVVAWLITAGMTLSAALLTTWSLPWMAAAVASWVLGLALCAWAGLEGWRAVRRALSRLAPDFGTVSALAVLAVGLVGGTLFWRPPEALGFDLRFAPYVAVFVGIGAACSLGMPLVCSLHALRRRLSRVGGEVASEPAPSSAG